MRHSVYERIIGQVSRQLNKPDASEYLSMTGPRLISAYSRTVI